MSTPTTHDPFYGLLSSPPGEWSLCRHGPNGLQWVILKGSPTFHQAAFNLFDSFVGGADRPVEVRRFEIDEVVAISLNETRILRALHLYFWGQLVHARGEIQPIMGEDGEIADIEVMNTAWLEAEADRLAAAFHRHMDETPCPLNPNVRDETPIEARIMLHSPMVDNSDSA